jgi:hypothetical protein
VVVNLSKFLEAASTNACYWMIGRASRVLEKTALEIMRLAFKMSISVEILSILIHKTVNVKKR